MKIVKAQVQDCADILYFITQLAIYEKMQNEVTATVAALKQTLFGDRAYAEVLFIEDESSTRVGFALFFSNYSTFLAKPGIYLEDLYVLPDARGRGYGKKLLCHLAHLAVERGCGRLDWSVLDWNQPAIDFYKSLGAVLMTDWTVNRVSGAALKNLAALGSAQA